MESVALGERWWGVSFGERYRVAVTMFLCLFLVFAGGASRSDEPSQTLVRVAAILATAASLWPLQFDRLPKPRWLLALGAILLLPILQLIPLPPTVWAALPGHAPYAQIAAGANAIVWRPLSLTPDLTLDALYATAPPIAAAICLWYLSSSNRILVLYAVVALALFSAALGFAQIAAGADSLRLYREFSADSAVGLFANRNHQAVLLACALPLAGVGAGMRMRLGGDGRLIPVVAFAVGAILEAGIVSTGSRMGLVLGVAGALGGLACYRACGLALIPERAVTRILAAGLIIAVGAAISLEIAESGAVARFGSDEPAIETRTAMVGPLTSTAEAFMPLGSGFGSFDNVYRRFEPPRLLSTIYMNQAHDEPMQLAIEGGVPALGLLGLFCWWWLAAARRAVRSTDAPPGRAVRMAAGMVSVMLMVSSLVDYPLHTPLLGALFIFALLCLTGAAAAPNAGPRHRSTDTRAGGEGRRWA